MTKVLCRAVVQWEDNIVLVRKTKSDIAEPRWRLPEREMRNNEGMLECMRRGVLEETGHEVLEIRLLNIISSPETGSREATLKLLFSCTTDPQPVHTTQHVTQVFTTEEILHLDAKKIFHDYFLLDIIFKYKAGIPHKSTLLGID